MGGREGLAQARHGGREGLAQALNGDIVPRNIGKLSIKKNQHLLQAFN